MLKLNTTRVNFEPCLGLAIWSKMEDYPVLSKSDKLYKVRETYILLPFIIITIGYAILPFGGDDVNEETLT